MPLATNLSKLNTAARRWIAEASGRADGAQLLARKADWIAEQIAVLGRSDATPDHLVGLTVWDLQAAEAAVRSGDVSKLPGKRLSLDDVFAKYGIAPVSAQPAKAA